ncbi:MAG: nucleotide sugar dehydrogenase [Thermoplasmata archaeon]
MKLVVLGLGQVGIPLAVAFAGEGHEVVGIDIDPRKVEAINGGTNPLPTREEDLDRLLGRAVESGALLATSEYDPIGEAEAIFVCVDTPVDATGRPDYAALRDVLTGIASRLQSGVLISIESTLAPGTMEDLVRPLLEQGSGMRVHKDFHLVHCPERVTSGKLLYNLTHMNRVVGGNDPEARSRAVELYAEIGHGNLLETDWTSAELSKTVENAYRDVQLAFANEVALICEEVGVDAFAVRELVNSSPGRAMLRPGPGVGGHCLSKDSLLLASAARNDVRLLTSARNVNEGMLNHVVTLIEQALATQSADLSSATVVLLGAAYKANVADTPNSPALAIAPILEEKGANVRIHDPHVEEREGVDLRRDLGEAMGRADCVVLVTDHDAYQDLDWGTLGEGMRHRLVVDCRGALGEEDLAQYGFGYVGLGRGSGG